VASSDESALVCTSLALALQLQVIHDAEGYTYKPEPEGLKGATPIPVLLEYCTPCIEKTSFSYHQALLVATRGAPGRSGQARAWLFSGHNNIPLVPKDIIPVENRQ
jgi:hypothetical protein